MARGPRSGSTRSARTSLPSCSPPLPGATRQAGSRSLHLAFTHQVGRENSATAANPVAGPSSRPLERPGMRYLALLSLALCLLLTSPLRAEEGKDAAVAAAQAWLATVDAGDYAGSWKATSTYFQGAVSQGTFSAQLQGVRGPLGALKSRKLTSATFTTSVPGAPDGKYWVLQFTTSFDKKASAVETVTPMLDQGEWKVGGYYIR